MVLAASVNGQCAAGPLTGVYVPDVGESPPMPPVARPVVATHIGGVAEAVVDGETGWLLPPGRLSEMADALVELARDRRRAEVMGAAGRERQQRHFSVEAMTRAYADLLDGIGVR